MSGVQKAGSIQERDVARRNVEQIDSVFFKRGQDLLDLWPAPFKLLPFLRFPIRPDFRRKFRPRVQVRPGEIEHERTLDDRHFDNVKVVVKAEQFRDVKTEDAINPLCLKPLIHGLFPQIKFSKPVGLDGYSRGECPAPGDPNDSVLARAEQLRDLELTPGGIGANICSKLFVHDDGTKLRRAFGPGRDAAHCQRLIHWHNAHGPRFRAARIFRPISAGRGDNSSASGPERESLESPLAGRDFRRVQARSHCQRRIATALDFWHEPDLKGFFHRHNCSTGPRSGERGKEQLNAQHEQTKPILQRGHALVSAESVWRILEKIRRGDYSKSRLELERFAARTMILTAEPIFRAGKQIGASAVGIESLQQSVLISSGPGFLLRPLFTRDKQTTFLISCQIIFPALKILIQ